MRQVQLAIVTAVPDPRKILARCLHVRAATVVLASVAACLGAATASALDSC